ncbi:Rubrerythrin [Dehalogenimonas formicexedens]|uniref:Rubrerythrin n=1 Tax=Dehalogenimonas formicexedens TaxID=1839801 RepID=A0A1P8F842_9CHLR|nr:ferritin family protein [Dehalogenimonas formicexedens]APV44641.1 Rubrerythrin [Dehalogenimonas formicexedens]
MTIAFSPAELYNIAIAVERRGAAFYDTLARSSQNDLVRQSFLALAAMEHQHIQAFQKMLASAPKTFGEGYGDEEYAAYFKALVDSAIFNDDLATSELVTKVDSDKEAVEIGMGAEKDSILFYEQLQDIAGGDASESIGKIISEEKEHLRKLAEIKTKLQ